MIREYINYLVNIKGYSKNTARAYEMNLRYFACWLREKKEDARWSKVSRDDIDAYITEKSIGGKSASTTNQILASISGLYNYFKRSGLQVDNPCRYESRKRISERVPNVIEDRALLDAYNHSAGATKALLGLLITTGVRIQEALDLTFADIDFESGALKIHGKGAKERIAQVPAKQLQDITSWRGRGAAREHVFEMSQRDARFMIFAALKPFSNACQLSPHAIRHSYATRLAAAGVNTTSLAALMGHQDINTTAKYINLGAQRAEQLNLAYNILS